MVKSERRSASDAPSPLAGEGWGEGEAALPALLRLDAQPVRQRDWLYTRLPFDTAAGTVLAGIVLTVILVAALRLFAH